MAVLTDNLNSWGDAVIVSLRGGSVTGGATRVSQVPVEVLSDGAPSFYRLSQIPVEVLSSGSPSFLRISQIAVEMICDGVVFAKNQPNISISM